MPMNMKRTWHGNAVERPNAAIGCGDGTTGSVMGSDGIVGSHTSHHVVHEWCMGYERQNRGPPRDGAQLVAALVDRFGSDIRPQEAQSQFMPISQGQGLCKIMPSNLNLYSAP